MRIKKNWKEIFQKNNLFAINFWAKFAIKQRFKEITKLLNNIIFKYYQNVTI